ncbi:MAG: GNAT family N-acetyltransferase [Lachnospiraceae bacterium]|nr:GNAT family N-acetyltransferase [Lachnospiraceae bacterium]
MFDNHYGIWGEGSSNKGARIRFPKSLYETYRNSDNTYVALAFLDGEVIGQAFYLKKVIEGENRVAWVLQLVVHEKYRKRGIAKTLLYSIWGFSDDYAWGLATSNALTVKTLEKATFRKVRTEEMIKHKEKILMVKEEIPFARENELMIEQNVSILDSGFPVDRAVIDHNLQLYEGEWELGALPIGHEWLAFTFRDQECQITKEEYEEMFENSEKIVNDAYNRMNLSEQPWTRHQREEVDFVLQHLDAERIHKVIDFGCGNGRHALEFAGRGFDVLGVDYSERNIRIAKSKGDSPRVRFVEGDCRSIELKETADLALCLYDVVGSFVKEKDNLDIIRNIYRHLNESGLLVMSVMNLELTSALAKNWVSDLQKELETLVKLPPSRIMQSSGNIFNPDYYLLETNTGVVYRKEQFENEGDLSAEYVIRDKRYSRREICGLLELAGFRILETRYVQAGRWEKALDAEDLAAKEILIFAEKMNFDIG